MVKIRDIEQSIEDALSWRKKEIFDFSIIIKEYTKNRKNTAQKNACLRAGIVFLYAHWEGGIKELSKIFIEYINTQKIKNKNLPPTLLGSSFKTKIDKLIIANKVSIHKEFAEFLVQSLEKNAVISKDLIETQGNLSSSVFFEILTRLNLPKNQSYEDNIELIDKKLVHQRNTIAHGDYLPISYDDYEIIKSTILDLLDIFTTDLIKNANQVVEFSSAST